MPGEITRLIDSKYIESEVFSHKIDLPGGFVGSKALRNFISASMSIGKHRAAETAKIKS